MFFSGLVCGCERAVEDNVIGLVGSLLYVLPMCFLLVGSTTKSQ